MPGLLSSPTYTYCPEGSEATNRGKGEAGKGEPGTAVRTPVSELIENADTELPSAVLALLATNKKRPLTSTAAETGFSPVGNGEPGMGVKPPEAASIAYPYTEVDAPMKELEMVA